MRKFLLWAAAVTFSFAAFLASCATQPQSHDQAPAACTQHNGCQNSDNAGSKSDNSTAYFGGSLSR